jgi:hypothetical protein
MKLFHFLTIHTVLEYPSLAKPLLETPKIRSANTKEASPQGPRPSEMFVCHPTDREPESSMGVTLLNTNWPPPFRGPAPISYNQINHG